MKPEEVIDLEVHRLLTAPPSNQMSPTNAVAVFRVEYCPQCRKHFVRCPVCGNNSCNGGYGLDGRCKVCPLTYALMQGISEVARQQGGGEAVE